MIPGNGGVGIAQNQYGIRFFLMEDCLDFDQGLAQDMPQAGGVHPQIIVGACAGPDHRKNLVEFVT